MGFYQKLSIAVLVVALSGCSGSSPKSSTPAASVPPSPTPSPSTSPSIAANPNSNIGKADAQGTTVTVDVPDSPLCDPETTQTTKEVFETCLIEDLTFVQASNVIGFKGELASQSGATEIMQWDLGKDSQIITAVFQDKKLKSKSQVNLN
ncbi:MULTISPECIES: hypothetical protein [Cyanophyceae]|uniref:Lipoprotein n=1 Tax=Stenomitos frigidus AS-A4 TaxID=2933935 RepID=A0ABV0KEI0_9CYAN|nr:hypothetical protein [Phormidium sp. FACHB-592]